MRSLILPILVSLSSWFQTRTALQVEMLALRHQLNVLKRAQQSRARLSSADRLLWVWLSHFWSGWRSALLIVKPETVIAWHRKGFRLYWTWKSRSGKSKRPETDSEIRDLIHRISLANPLWGAPRIHGELLKLGIPISQATVAKYMACHRKPPSQTWRAFLRNHVEQLVSTEFFVVPTASFRVWFVFVVLAHNRRRVIHFNVTANPTSEWAAHQIVEAFPWGSAPRYLLHDRDSIYGDSFRQTVRGMAIGEVRTAPRSPWQNAYVERLIGSIRRECLDHVIVLNESSLRHILNSYFRYYRYSRTHLSLDKDAPEPRAIQPPELGVTAEIPEVGGLHHRYERRAA